MKRKVMKRGGILMKMNRLQVLTRTAVLLALTIVFQNLRIIPVIGAGPQSQFIIGSLVNAALIVSVGTVNLYSAIIICIAAPLIAYIQGQLPPVLPYMIPIVAVGNAVLVISFYLFRKRLEYVGILVGAVAKCLILYFAVRFMLQEVKGGIAQKTFATLSKMLSFNFSWPQLVTALIGGFIGILAINALQKTVKNV